jgi:hypothetical protein
MGGQGLPSTSAGMTGSFLFSMAPGRQWCTELGGVGPFLSVLTSRLCSSIGVLWGATPWWFFIGGHWCPPT